MATDAHIKYRILIRRMLFADLPASAPEGEPLVTTDTHQLFVGTGSGIVEVVPGGSVTVTYVNAQDAATLAAAEAYTDAHVPSGVELQANKGQANGYPSLDGTAHVPLSQLPASVVGALQYQGVWNATTNSPTLADGVGTKGFFYKVSAAGSTSLDGNSGWHIGDIALFDGTVWDKIDNYEAVVSVAGKTGAVTLVEGDIASLASDLATLTSAISSEATTRSTADGLRELLANKDIDGTLASNSDTKYPSQKAVKTYADTKQSALGFTAENVANKDTDGTLAANSDTNYASQKAAKTYIDAEATRAIAAEAFAAKKDTMILTSAVDASGNPNFLSIGSGATVNVNGGTTPIVCLIAGVKQVISANLTVTGTTPLADSLYFVFAKKNSTGVIGSSDLVISAVVPQFEYAVTPSTGSSNTNLAVWFDLSTNTTKTASTIGGAFAVDTDMILLGVAIITATPTIRAVLCEPYRLDHYSRVARFQIPGNSNAFATTTNNVAGMKKFRSFAIDGGIYRQIQSSTSVGLIVYSQTPVIITNSGTFGGVTNLAGGAGQANAPGTAGSAGGLGGGGGGGGGAPTTRIGGAGGNVAVPGRVTAAANGGNGGAIATIGGAGTASFDFGAPYISSPTLFFIDFQGASGGGGAGDGNGTGGTGGTGGGVNVLIAPSVLIDTGCVFTSAGGDGAAGGGTGSGGGGGGGGGLALIHAGFITNNGTLTVAGGAGGAKAGTGGNGGAGGAGQSAAVKLW